MEINKCCFASERKSKKNTVLRLEVHTSCIEQERFPSNVAPVITRKVKQADNEVGTYIV
jgi:hypothetical protein